MSTKQNTTRGSHYLPQTYLKNFLLNNELVMYKKGEKFFSKKCSEVSRIVTVRGEKNISAIAKENNLYRIDLPGVKPDIMEDIFNDLIEGKISSMIASIRSMNIGDKIDPKLKKNICLLLSTMLLRTPGHKAEIDQITTHGLKFGFEKSITKTERENWKKQFLEEEGREICDEEIDNAIQAFLDGQITLALSSSCFSKYILRNVEHYTNIFNNMKMNILRTDDNSPFITSDNPVVYFVPNDKVDFYNAPRSLASIHTEVYFPISKEHCVLLVRKEINEMLLPSMSQIFDIIENGLSCHSRDFIFSPIRKNVLDDFAKEYIPYPFKLVVS